MENQDQKPVNNGENETAVQSNKRKNESGIMSLAKSLNTGGPGTSAGSSGTLDLFKYADMEQCKDAMEMLNEKTTNNMDYGWWIFNIIKKQELFLSFENNAEKAKKIFDVIMDIINLYYVHAETHIKKICREENIPEREYDTSKNSRVSEFYKKYLYAIKQREYVCLDIPLKDLSTLYVNLNALIVGLCTAKMKLKSIAVMNILQKSVHIPLLIPFNHDIDLLFQGITISPNENYSSQVDADPDNAGSVPLMFVSGYVAVICEMTEAKKPNKDGNKFKVLNIKNPSAMILQQHFNNYIRKLYPTKFPKVPYMYVQLSESLNTANVNCLEQYQNRRPYLVLANMANIFIKEYNNKYVPQLQMWCNVKLES